MDLKVGELIGGKYRIVRCIGVGGMGSVYEARHAGLGTPLAVKVLLPQLAKVPTVADRFRREAQVSATLASPHVIRVTDVDQLPDGRPYLAMELLLGESLQKLLDREKRLARELAVDIGLQILLGLESAHALGVVHRDLKPDNVFLSREGYGQVAKILDFGIAKVRATPEFQALTRPGMVMGTPQYMAPEQAFSAADVDARGDIYSVGVMLYEMLSGVLPAEGSIPVEVARKVVSGQVRPLQEICPGLPAGLVSLVQRALSPQREDRFESALEMRRALSAFAGQLSIAGHVAATAALGDRKPPVKTRAGTEKVAVVDSQTGEMSNFRSVHPPVAGAVPVRAAPPSGTAPIPASPPIPIGAAAPPAAAGAAAAAGVPAAAAPAAAAAPGASPVAAPAAAAAPGASPVAAPAAAAAPVPAAAAGVAAAPAPAKPISRTAEMPKPPGARVLTPTLSTEEGRSTAPRRRRWPWIVLGGLLLGAGFGAFWFLQLPEDPGPPPPMPTPQPAYYD